jgi:hypothetical protein
MFPSITLLDHQVEHADRVYRSLSSNQIAFDTSDTGTGKTYVACEVAGKLCAHSIVVICPNIVERKWTTILGDVPPDRWMVLPYSLLTRTAKTNGFFTFTPQTSGELLINGNGKFYCKENVKDFDVELKRGTKLCALISSPRTLLILDETHKVKNSTTQASGAVLKMVEVVRGGGGWVLHVSATPFDQLFQLPLYLRFMLCSTTDPVDRARRLVQLAKEQELRSAGGNEECWDVLQCIRGVLGVVRSVEDGLFALSKTGSDTGSKWKAVHAFLGRLCGMYPMEALCEYMMPYRIEKSTDLASKIGTHEAACLAKYLKDHGPSHNEFYGRHGYTVILDAILWPFAITELDADIELARELVLSVLSQSMFRMVMPDLGFRRHDLDLFLDDVDVSASVAELTYLPDYKTANVPGPMMAAPLVSPDCLHRVPEAVAACWQDPTWRLGQRRPVDVWEEITAQARAAGKDHRSAEAMAMMCKVVHGFCSSGSGAGSGSGSGVAESPGLDEDNENPRIRLESLKVPSLFKVVSRVLDDDAGSKVVVMFNFLEPLEQFVILFKAHRVVKVTGALPPSKRADAVELFNSNPGSHRILVCTIQVMNEGIDLHDTRGSEHRYSFIMACPSAIMTQQAKGRIFRAGIRSHAINCVVFGGYSLGGDIEARLIKRISTKNATLQTVSPTTTVTSLAEFRDMCVRIHASQSILPHLPTSSSPSLVQPLPDTIFGTQWLRREFAMRMWPSLKLLRDNAGEEGHDLETDVVWRRLYNETTSGKVENFDGTCGELSEYQLRKVGLVSQEKGMGAFYHKSNICTLWVWPFMQTDMMRGFIHKLTDQESLRKASYDTAWKWAVV